MNAPDSHYTVGRGKPPLHTRFRKGQSGNPSGKPGPAKLARQQFQRALCAALEQETADLKEARPRCNVEVLARRLTLDAVGGRLQAMKLLLSELDKEIARSSGEEAGEVHQESGDARAAGDVDEGGDTDEPPPLEDYALWLKANRGE